MIVSLQGVDKIYPPHQPALRKLNLHINGGDFIFIAGASGAGKSTLLKLLLGSERASAGTVAVLGKNMSMASEYEIAQVRKRIGIVFQDFRLLKRKNLLENVSLPLEIRNYKKSDIEARSLAMLDALGLRDRAYDYPVTLSGGEQQRVAIARALVGKPDLLFADEPTGNLDTHMSRIVFNLLLEANAAGVTVVVASHNLAMIEELNLRTVVLDKGEIVGDFEQPKGVR